VIIEVKKNKAKEIFLDYLKRNKQLTIDEFLTQFNDKSYKSDSFYEFIEAEIKQRLRIEFAAATIRTYNTNISKLKQFKDPLMFGDITPEFVRKYKLYMIDKLGNNPNTVNKSLSWLRSCLYKARNAKKIERSPFEEKENNDLRIGKIEGNRQFLIKEEVLKLEKLFETDVFSSSKRNVLRYFLFCCFTGLRYYDIKNLRNKDIIEDRTVISIIMHKTKDIVRIPLNEHALRLLPRENGIAEARVFHVLTDQPTNRYLKDIMGIAEIGKTVSFHCARHTFATIALDIGVPLEVVSKILGHKELSTTLIYARISDASKKREMEKFNTF
jgi:integrase